MAKIVILGAGAMGSAFSVPVSDAGQDVHLVGTHLDRDWIEEIQANGVHPKLRVKLPEKVSSPGIDWAIKQLGPLLRKPIPVLLLTKGLAARNKTLQVLSDIVYEGLADYGVKNVSVGAVGGPCLARELAARRDCCVVFAHPDQTVLDWMLSLVTTPYYHTQSSTDLIGVEVCAALKNFYALAVSYPRGIGEKIQASGHDALMYSIEAGLFPQAMAEMKYIVNSMNGAADTADGWAGAGDLYGTCQIGRNGQMGRLLGLGLPYQETKAKYMADDTVEGAELALTIGPTIESLIEQHHLDGLLLPLTRTIIQAICHNQPMSIPWIQRTA